MRAQSFLASVLTLGLPVACVGDKPGPGDTAAPDTAESGEHSSDTQTGDTSETGDTGETGDTEESGETADTPPPVGESIDDLAVTKWLGDGEGAGELGSLEPAGNVGGDDGPAFLVGAPFQGRAEKGHSGAVYLVSAEDRGLLSLVDADAQVTTAARETLGWSVAAGVDLNGDGWEDLAIGAPYHTVGPDEWQPLGAVYLQYGPITGELPVADADVFIEGVVSGHPYYTHYGPMAGSAVALLEDSDGDARGELVIDVPGFDRVGAIYILSPPFTASMSLATDFQARIYEHSSGDPGYLVDTFDADGDGVSDILATSYPLVRIYAGPFVGDVNPDDTDVWFEDDVIGLIGGPALAGDVDGDGREDLWLGRVADDAGPQMLLFPGPFKGEVLASSAVATVAGGAGWGIGSAADAGDVNGDGHRDVAGVTRDEPGGAENAGAAVVLYGPFAGTITATEAAVALTDDDPDGIAGGTAALLGAGDVDRDGLDDLLVLSPSDDEAAEDAGAVWLVLGSSIPSP